MPTYEYDCSSCGLEFELVQRMTDPPRKRCPRCRSKVHRRIGAGAGLIFHGSGFYVTDYRSEDYKAKAKAESEKASGARGGEGSSSSSGSGTSASGGSGSPGPGGSGSSPAPKGSKNGDSGSGPSSASQKSPSSSTRGTKPASSS